MDYEMIEGITEAHDADADYYGCYVERDVAQQVAGFLGDGAADDAGASSPVCWIRLGEIEEVAQKFLIIGGERI